MIKGQLAKISKFNLEYTTRLEIYINLCSYIPKSSESAIYKHEEL